MNKKIKKTVSILLASSMLMAIMPGQISAADAETEEAYGSEIPENIVTENTELSETVQIETQPEQADEIYTEPELESEVLTDTEAMSEIESESATESALEDTELQSEDTLTETLGENDEFILEMMVADEEELLALRKVSAASGYDTTAPVVNSVTFTESVIKPGVVTVTVDATEEETGIIGIDLYFGNDNVSQPIIYRCGLWNNYVKGEWEKSPKPSGIYKFSVSVPSNARSGEWYLNQINIADQAGNNRMYWYVGGDKDNRSWQEWKGSVVENISLNVNNGNNILIVKDEFDVGFQSYITMPNIDTKLQEMEDGLTAMINFDSNNCIAKKEWFDIIAKTNKSIVFSNNGIQWAFHGQDISMSKDIDLSLAISKVSSAQYGDKSNALKLEFASNGQLPGKATVRIKADYIYNLKRLSGILYLYYMNSDQSLSLENNPKYILDGKDHWCEFDVTHNSTFLVSGRELSTQALNIKLNKTSLLLNKGKSSTLKATVGLASVKGQKVTWHSSNKKVATVSDNGKVTAKGYGTATITVKTNDGSKKTAKCKVTVGYPITYKLNGGTNDSKNPKLYYKEKITLKAPGKKGYLFQGWYTDSKYKKKITKISSKTNGKLVLYAKWKKVTVDKVSVTSLKNSSSKKAALKFKKVSGASGYEILYATDKKFKKNKKTTTTKKASVSLKDLSKKKTYYVKVRAYTTDSTGKKVYGEYSDVVSVKIKK